MLPAMEPRFPLQPFFKQKKSLGRLPSTAASYLSAVHEADARARYQDSSSVISTPTFSRASSITSSPDDTVLSKDDKDNYFACPRTPAMSEQVFNTVHTEFGYCANEAYRCTSRHDYTRPVRDPMITIIEDPPYYIFLTTYMSYLILHFFGRLRDFFGMIFIKSQFARLLPSKGYAPLNSDFDSFYLRRLRRRVVDCVSHPVTGVPGRSIVILDRYSADSNRTLIYTGGKTRALNISSYNYLGFAQARSGCTDVIAKCIERYSISTCGTRLEGGSSELHVTAEALTARFIGMEDALISSMGFATNSTFIPALIGKGCLVISDEFNHTSIRTGARQGGGVVRIFKHNDMSSLESLLREEISQGQPKTHRPWKKILLIVEGLYSMEGTLVNLPRIIELKHKYKFYLYVDEAHSVGALGPHGRGITDYFNIDPRSIDILMGTFSKAFGATGGYIAGSKAIIDTLRVHGHSGPYAEAMAPPAVAQIIAAMASIMGIAPAPQQTKSALSLNSDSSVVSTLKDNAEELSFMAPASMMPTWMSLPPDFADGSETRTRIRRLAFNSRYLHAGLRKLGFITYGHPISPIVPLIICNPGKMALFVHMMRAWSTPIVVVIAAYPATSAVTGRARLCTSAAHTKDDIDTVLRACDEIGEILDMKYGSGERWGIEEVCKRAVELAHSPI